MLLLVLLLVTLDAKNRLNVSGGPLRYLILLPPLLSAIMIRLRVRSTLVRRPTGSDAVLFTLFAWGLVGTFYGIVFQGTKDNMSSAFLPMAIALTPLAVLEGPTEREIERILKWLGWIGALYIAMNAIVNAHLVPSLLASRQYRNALLAFVAMGVASAIVLRRRGRLALLLALAAVIFVGYPSGTFALVGVSVLATLWMTKPTGSRLRPYFLGAVLVATLVLALANFQGGVNASSQYFQAVGKANDNATRLALWRAGLVKFETSPLVGTGFAGSTTITTYRPLKRSLALQPLKLPFHNDYILFMANGGILGVGLLLLWIVLTEVTALGRYQRFVVAGQRTHAGLLRVLLVGFNAFFCSAAFNPEFTGVGRSAAVCSMYALMMIVGSPGANAASLDSRVSATRSTRAVSRPIP